MQNEEALRAFECSELVMSHWFTALLHTWEMAARDEVFSIFYDGYATPCG